MTCQKCGAERPEGATECPQCGIIYERLERSAARKRAAMLTTCPACGKEVSRQAPTCPGCGQPIAAGTTVGGRGGAVSRPTNGVGAQATREDKKSEAAAQAGMGCFIGCGALILIILAILMFGGDGGKNVTTPTTTDAQSGGKPFVKTRNVPIVIDDDANIIGCHDINDYWMALGLKDGDRDAQLRPRLADGRCGRIAAGRGNAVEILPSGVAEIRDSRGVKWYVKDADLKAHHAH